MHKTGTILEVGKCYFRKRAGRGSVRKITKIENGKVFYIRLFGIAIKKGIEDQCSHKTFRQWKSGEINENENFKGLNGAKLLPAIFIESATGEKICRCFPQRAQHYLRKKFADRISDDIIRLNKSGEQIEINLKTRLFKNQEKNPFFLEIKNDKCACCGTTYDLTRHHIVPKRHKKKIPEEIRKNLSNVLFICQKCHCKYEIHSRTEPNDSITDPIQLIEAWKNHFISIMQPKFLPNGWDIFV